MAVTVGIDNKDTAHNCTLLISRGGKVLLYNKIAKMYAKRALGIFHVANGSQGSTIISEITGNIPKTRPFQQDVRIRCG